MLCAISWLIWVPISVENPPYTVNPRFWNRGFWNNLDSGMGFAADQT